MEIKKYRKTERNLEIAVATIVAVVTKAISKD